MKKRNLTKVIGLLLVSAMVLTGCSGNGKVKTGNKAESSTEGSSSGKKSFIVYNCAGAMEFHEDTVAAEFAEKYGDKYDVKVETLTAEDVISKIEAQGLEAGKGNVNIVIMGDSDVPKGLKAGVFADLSEYKEEFHIEDLNEFGKESFEMLDESAVPAMQGISAPAIAYMPDTAIGERLDAVIGDDEEITYDELREFLLTDEGKPKFGRGRISNSGPGDYWTWGLLQTFEEYGKDATPDKSIDWSRELYQGGSVQLYNGTADTFKDLTEGSVDIIPHSAAWYYRLYSLGKVNDELPENLKVDSFGLENSKYAFMTGPNVTNLVTAHFYMIPSNLSEEDFEISKEFMEFAVTPEINSQSYISLMQPAFSYSSIHKVEDEDILTVWNEVVKYFPERYLVDNGGTVKELGLAEGQEYVFSVSDVNLLTKYSQAWADELEANIQK